MDSQGHEYDGWSWEEINKAYFDDPVLTDLEEDKPSGQAPRISSPPMERESNKEGNASTSKKKSRASTKTSDAERLRGLLRHDVRSVLKAREAPVVFDSFDLRQTVEAASGKGPPPCNLVLELETAWLDDKPRLAVDKNGIPIVLHIPCWQRTKSLNKFNDDYAKLCETTKPTAGGDADGKWRNSKATYRQVEGKLCGRIKLVTCWHAIGHSKEPPVPSSTILGSGRKFSATTEALSEFQFVAKRLNNVLEHLDPGAVSQYSKLRETSMDKLPYLRAFNAVDPSYWQGRRSCLTLRRQNIGTRGARLWNGPPSMQLEPSPKVEISALMS
ncbi:hypothetical protein BJ322DRAFT_1110928 [Thelephora terrestris]|uniref:Uncharacterized protein n=1 Tax=Thelephora terrestris TaxID=56493 RepID=A0A9P6H9K3_9AGAM|nr:hypothetical protein BJ322DRAFT_1110928 [Thelephora terrestris]